MNTTIGQGKTVLLIEDDEIHRKLVKMRLQQMGFVVLGVAHHGEADQVLAGGVQKHEIAVDLVVSDNNTTECKETGKEKKYLGIQWVKKLRGSDSVNKDVPVVLHTATHDPEKREQQAMDAGANVFLHKVLPDDPDEALSSAIEEALGTK